MKKIIIISHKEDLDGIGAAAILKRYYDQKKEYSYNFYFSLYSEFVDLFSKVILKDFTLFYITDIGFNNSFLQFFRGEHPFFKNNDYETVKKKIKKIHWLDHHLIKEENLKFMRSLLFDFSHDIENTCASKIIYEYLNKKFNWNDDVAKKIANYANEIDHNVSLKVSDIIQRVINSNQNNFSNLIKSMEYLSKGEFEHPWFIKQNEERLKVEKIELKRVLNNLQKLKILDLKIIVAESEILTTGYLIKYLYNNISADIYLTINNNQVSIRSHKLNVREMAIEFDGGGHKLRAGFYYENIIQNDKINPKFVKKFKKVIKKIHFI